ncbi:type IX secretion system sortase PorU [Bacteroidales bacterium OttesenSCG-928-I14]|nr:type IX secretion system sortase PorU [Bacteroidales bacterium OttesenSCG-928-I14]
MNRLKTGLLLFLCMFSFLAFAENDGERYAKSSAMAEGKWVKIQTPENGVYKLTYDEIKKMGFSNPAKVSIYGYGGWMLSEDFRQAYIDDLPEVSVWINKGSDGVFNSGDYLLFYGRGTVSWRLDSDKVFRHRNNPYDVNGHYFVAENSNGPKELEKIPSHPETSETVNTFTDYRLYEKDLVYLLESGKELFDNSFDGKTSSVNKVPTKEYEFNIPGITSDPGNVTLSFAASPTKTTPASLSIDGTELIRMSLSPPGGYSKADLEIDEAKWLGDKKEKTIVAVSYNTSGQPKANLDYISLNMQRKLQFYNEGYTFFRNPASLNASIMYEIDNAKSGYMVWDITGIYDIALVDANISGTKLSFGAESSKTLREYVMINPSSSFLSPTVLGEVKNQNLHALEQTDMVIISPRLYLSYAEQLADLHRNEGLKVIVIQPEWIYNEFASGTRDATAYRRFMKMFFDRAETENDKPRYLLLYGDGIFDNRHLSKDGAKLSKDNYLLTYQVDESLNEVSSYGTDDYFGFLEDKEGTNLKAHTMDIGVGRFPVSSVEQAKNAYEKVKTYMENKEYGAWKNKLIFTADNSDYTTPGSSFCKHGKQADSLARRVMEDNFPQYINYKSFMDAYKPTDLNGKKVIPGAKDKFMTVLKDGCFVVNYCGHGSTTAWSSEDLLNIQDVRQMNFTQLPLWITSTCDFGWPDRFVSSGGEEAFLNKKSGAIALFTTARVVFADSNYKMHKSLLSNLFARIDGEYPRLGDVSRISKNELGSDSNKLNYILFGDPALRLNYPEFDVRLEKVNDEEVDDETVFNFRALDRITLEGSIVDYDGEIINDFNGNIVTNIFDSQQMFQSYYADTAGGRWTFPDYPSVVYIGNDEVENGRFKVNFLVPLDISYTLEKGKLNFYAYDSEKGLEANGSFKNYTLSGTNEEGLGLYGKPEIRAIYLNTPSFNNGDVVNNTPYFVAEVFDENGINMTGGGGHDITISIDNKPSMTYNINSYYTPNTDGSGELKFSIPSIPNGEHQLVFKVWNILNQSASDTITFVVNDNLEPELFDIIATAIPARTSTSFLLQHDRPETNLELEIYVYDLTGQSVWYHREVGSSGWLKYYPIEWDLTNGSGARVSPGIYIFKAIVGTPGGKQATKAKKIIVLGQ